MGWRKIDPAISSGGDVGGDIQATESFSVRFLPESEPEDGYHALVTVCYYGATGGDGYVPGTFPEGYWVQTQTEFLICTDLGDPGGTEVWADYIHEDSYEVGLMDGDGIYPTALAAETAARQMAQVSDPAYITWDGRSAIR